MSNNGANEKALNEEQKLLDDMIKKINNYEKALEEKAKTGHYRVATGMYDDNHLDIQKNNDDFKKLGEQIVKIRKQKENGLYSSHIKVDTNFEGEKTREDFFIGNESIFIGDEKIVYDWQKEGTIGRALIEARRKQAKRFRFKNAEYEVLLDRNVIVNWKNEKVVDVVTRINLLGEKGIDLIVEYSGIADEKLIQLRRDNKINGSLFETVSKEQFDIIKSKKTNSIVVQGCAGSGKTAVMLHKISNYISNVDDSKRRTIMSQIRIITPSPYVKPLYSDMYDSLSLTDIPCKTIESYYIELLRNYSKKIKIDTKIVDEKKLNKVLLKYFYTQGKDDLKNSIIGSIANEMKDILPNIQIKNAKQIRLAQNEVSNYLFNSLFKGGLFQRDINEDLKDDAKNEVLKALREHNKIENEYYQSMEKIKRNLIKERNRLSKKVILKNDSAKRINELKDNFLKINSFEKQILEDLTNGELKDKYLLEIIFKKKDSNMTDSTQFDKLQEIIEEFSYNKVIENQEFLLNNVILNQDIKDELKSLVKPKEFGNEEIFEIVDKVFSKEKRYNSNKDRNRRALLAYIKTDFVFIIGYFVERYIREVYRSYNVSYANHIYRYKLYLYLTVAEMYYEKKSIGAYINIDEAQDYSVNELNLLKDILGSKCRFDIYGDLNQKLQEYRSIDKWDDLSFVNKKNIYELNYSYRNTKSIIDFVNNKLNLSIKAITELGEEVKEYSIFKDALTYFVNLKNTSKEKDESIETYAIIVPIEVDMEEIMDEIHNCLGEEHLNDFVFDDISFGNLEIIPVIDVASAKGLEFRNVLVYNKNNLFTKNQMYVALTRSIKTLVYCEN